MVVATCTFVVSWGIISLFCFFCDGNDCGIGDRSRLNKMSLVSPYFAFRLRSFKLLSFQFYCFLSLCVYLLIKIFRIGFLFLFDLLLAVILSFSDKFVLSEDDPVWKNVLLKFWFRFVLLDFRRILVYVGFCSCVVCCFSKDLSVFGFCFGLNLK